MLTDNRLKELLADLEADNIERTVSTTNTDKFAEAVCAPLPMIFPIIDSPAICWSALTTKADHAACG
jgi:hypothetical protein